jgi:glycosyltransferase involved in cell wall biosynthesis
MKRVLIFYSHFSPAYKAGGPVQSLANLVSFLNDNFCFYVFCSAYEMGDAAILNGIIADRWNGYSKNVRVFYASVKDRKVIRNVIKDVNPDIIYVNGLYVPFFSVLPLVEGRKAKCKVILAPRGMLQEGALSVKPIKKKAFLFGFKLLRLHRNIIWHATDKQEATDIGRVFGLTSNIVVAANIPKRPLDILPVRSKSVGELRLVYLSLITEKKNLHFLLNALVRLNARVQLDIYGPIKDEHYWNNCLSVIKDSNLIRYKGIVAPEEVQNLLASYHAMVLPTKGENFGHAIYESLSAGTPVIISEHTPWGDVATHTAGQTISLVDESFWMTGITKFFEMPEHEFLRYSQGAFNLAKQYFYGNNFSEEYARLFE